MTSGPAQVLHPQPTNDNNIQLKCVLCNYVVVFVTRFHQ